MGTVGRKLMGVLVCALFCACADQKLTGRMTRVFRGAAVRMEIHGAAAGERLGSGVGGLADLNGDGHGEIAGGAPTAALDTDACPDSLPGRGVLRIYSGKDGTLLRTHCGEAPNESFGTSTRAVGDVDGDGAAEYAVAAPGASSDPTFCPDSVVGRGVVRIFSGRTGSLLRALCGYSAYENLTNIIADVGDLDGDGVADLVASSPFASTHPKACPNRPTDPDRCPTPKSGEPDRPCGKGYVEGRSGRDGALLFASCGARAGELYGFWVARADAPLLGGGEKDVDKDDRADLFVGAPLATCLAGEGGQEPEGIVFLLASTGGWDRSSRSTDRQCGDEPGEGLGAFPAETIHGDLNNDKEFDLLIGVPSADRLAGECDEPSVEGGVVQFFFGGSTKVRATVCGAQGEALGSGYDFLPVGDADGNGEDDPDELVVGVPGSDPDGKTNAGSILVLDLAAR